MGRSKGLWAVVAVGVGIAACAAPAGALLILDSFEDGAFNTNVLYGNPQATAEQSAPTGAAGGVRLVTVAVSGTGPLGSGSASLATSPGDDGVVLTTLGSGVNTGYQFIWDGLAGGVNDTTAGALRLDLRPYHSIQIDSSGAADGVSAQLTLWNNVGSAFGFTLPFTTGEMLLPLDGFGAFDLSKVRAIRIRLNDVELGDSFTITNITAVPEPGSALLLAAGLLGLARVGRPRTGVGAR